MTYEQWVKCSKVDAFHTALELGKKYDVNPLVTVSELKVMESAAGFYIGTEYFDEEMQAWFPNERSTPYMLTRGEAESMMEYWNEGS